MQAGDWVQAADKVTEPNFMGRAEWVHALKNAIGHVMEVEGDTATITWERTGTTCTVLLDELVRLGDYRTGK